MTTTSVQDAALPGGDGMLALQGTPTSDARSTTVSEVSPGQRHATLTLSPSRWPAGSTERGPAYAAHLDCGGFTVRLDDPVALGLIAYVLNVGTVRLQLPALPEHTPRVQAFRQDLPTELIALSQGKSSNLLARQREQAEAQFVRRFTTGLRTCFGAAQEAPAVVDWYRQKLTAARKAVPAELQVNTAL
jgi:hypothetical protein